MYQRVKVRKVHMKFLSRIYDTIDTFAFLRKHLSVFLAAEVLFMGRITVIIRIVLVTKYKDLVVQPTSIRI